MTDTQRRMAAATWLKRSEDELRERGAMTDRAQAAFDKATSAIDDARMRGIGYQPALQSLRASARNLEDRELFEDAYTVGVAADGLEMYVTQCELQLDLIEEFS